ncbi:hypothetical protein OQA88_8181 [Cercophora sp. LCS_1]
MKLESWLSAACLVSAASALGPNGPGKPPRPPGKPERISSWKWGNPFALERELSKFEAPCTAEKTFQAKEFLLDDLSEEPPHGLNPYMNALKKIFAELRYPGSWDGIDPHGYDRNLLQMEYTDLPIKVREWIEEQDRAKTDKKGLFAVYQKPTKDAKVSDTAPPPEGPIPVELRTTDAEKTVLFAPGALYEILPLFVAEDSGCADALLDITKYSATLADGGVIAYPIKKSRAKRDSGLRDIEFTIKAQTLKAKPEDKTEKAKEEAKGEEAAKDEL